MIRESDPNVFLAGKATIVRLSKLSSPLLSFPIMHFIGRMKLPLIGYDWSSYGRNMD